LKNFESPMDERKPHISEFGDFRLDHVRRLLLRGNELVALTPKVFDTLLYLVEHSKTVVTKDELMAAVWPNTVVEENNLGQNISKLRVVLGETRGENRYIATVPGTGYRFVADVKQLAEENQPEKPEKVLSGHSGTPASASVTESQRNRASIKTRVWATVSVGIVIALLGIGAFIASRTLTKPSSAQAPIRSLAVLPFKPLVIEGREPALELGMADTLITKLNIKEIIVRPIGAVRKYDGLEQDPIAAGRELGVDAVLDGTIQRQGDRIRVNVRLLRVSDNSTLWAEPFDERFGDIFTVQDSISERVTDALAVKLGSEEHELLTKRYTADAEAYLLYQKGRFHLHNRTRNEDEQAMEYFKQAIQHDPTYALAYAGISEYYAGLPIARDVLSFEAFTKAREAALKALEIDEQLAEAHATLGWIKFWFEWDWKGAKQEYERALKLNPNDFQARLGYAHLLSNLGRHDEALAEVDRALKVDPLSPLLGALKGQFLFDARRYREAIEDLHETLKIDPTFWITQIVLGKNYERDGRYDDALEAFQKARRFSGGTTAAISLTGFTYAVSGHPAEARRLLHQLEIMSKTASTTTYVPPYNIALIYHGLGNSDEAFVWLNNAYKERDVHMVFLGVEPKWDTLRGDQRFINIMKRMNLPQ
jgi:DNA-binding winged helix-turn-helix (wHTH) protein/TolB-like protein/Flp pilus assembly protein TadD